MSHVKSGGSSKNVHDSPGQRLGVKRSSGQAVKAGEIIIRQVGATKRAGKGTYMSRNFSIHAAKDGVVSFTRRKVKNFTGKTHPRVEVTVK